MDIRFIKFTLALFTLAATLNSMADDNIALNDDTDKASYSIGQQIGNDLKKQNITLDEAMLRRGIIDGLYDNPPLVPPREMNSRLMKLKKSITAQLNEETKQKLQARRELETKIRDAGKAYMQTNATKAGVKTTDSGLQYRVIQNGHGKTPNASDFVTVEYRARTVEGHEFDSSAKLGKPAVFRADSVLPGFNEAVQMMQPGAKWEIVMPPELAYGRRGLLAHQTIIMELELISIQKKPQQSDTASE